MLFPGAIIIAGIILIIVGICFSVAVGALLGIITGNTIDFFVHKTDTYKRKVRGEEGDYPWWLKDKYYFLYTWTICSCIVAYTVAGPIAHLIMWSK